MNEAAQPGVKGGMEQALRILIVTHAFPPMNSIGSHRPYSWARSWRDAGHQVHVLTPAKYAFDGSMDLDRDLAGIEVHEVPYLPWRGGRHRSDFRDRLATSNRWEWAKNITRRARYSLAMFADPKLLAYRALVRKGRDLVNHSGMDVIVATSPPEVCFLAARAVSRSTGVPWVADFRDLWFRDMRLHQSRLASRLSGPVNRWMVADASALITVSQGLQQRLSDYLGRHVFVSYNGFFESDGVSTARCRPWADTKLHLVYTGRLYRGKRDPQPLFRALQTLRPSLPDLSERLAVDFYGFDDPWLRSLVAKHAVGDCVTLHGFVPYQRSLELQRAADMLLFLDWADLGAEGVLTGKLFEYLGSGRPILSVGPRKTSEAASIIEAGRCGVTLVSVEEIAQFLTELLRLGRPAEVDTARVGRFSRRRQAEALLHVLLGALAAEATEVAASSRSCSR
jgi:glycosyltransferase involved in cell wall biosynthesis